MSLKINWDSLSRIKINKKDLDKEGIKNLIVKTILLRVILIKHKKDLYWLRIIDNYEIEKKIILDFVVENVRTKEIEGYILEKEQQIKKHKNIIDRLEKPFMKKPTIIVVDLNKLSDDIEELGNQIKELVF